MGSTIPRVTVRTGYRTEQVHETVSVEGADGSTYEKTVSKTIRVFYREEVVELIAVVPAERADLLAGIERRLQDHLDRSEGVDPARALEDLLGARLELGRSAYASPHGGEGIATAQLAGDEPWLESVGPSGVASALGLADRTAGAVAVDRFLASPSPQTLQPLLNQMASAQARSLVGTLESREAAIRQDPSDFLVDLARYRGLTETLEAGAVLPEALRTILDDPLLVRMIESRLSELEPPVDWSSDALVPQTLFEHPELDRMLAELERLVEEGPEDGIWVALGTVRELIDSTRTLAALAGDDQLPFVSTLEVARAELDALLTERPELLAYVGPDAEIDPDLLLPPGVELRLTFNRDFVPARFEITGDAGHGSGPDHHAFIDRLEAHFETNADRILAPLAAARDDLAVKAERWVGEEPATIQELVLQIPSLRRVIEELMPDAVDAAQVLDDAYEDAMAELAARDGRKVWYGIAAGVLGLVALGAAIATAGAATPLLFALGALATAGGAASLGVSATDAYRDWVEADENNLYLENNPSDVPTSGELALLAFEAALTVVDAALIPAAWRATKAYVSFRRVSRFLLASELSTDVARRLVERLGALVDQVPGGISPAFETMLEHVDPVRLADLSDDALLELLRSPDLGMFDSTRGMEILAEWIADLPPDVASRLIVGINPEGAGLVRVGVMNPLLRKLDPAIWKALTPEAFSFVVKAAHRMSLEELVRIVEHLGVIPLNATARHLNVMPTEVSSLALEVLDVIKRNQPEVYDELLRDSRQLTKLTRLFAEAGILTVQRFASLLEDLPPAEARTLVEDVLEGEVAYEQAGRIAREYVAQWDLTSEIERITTQIHGSNSVLAKGAQDRLGQLLTSARSRADAEAFLRALDRFGPEAGARFLDAVDLEDPGFSHWMATFWSMTPNQVDQLGGLLRSLPPDRVGEILRKLTVVGAEAPNISEATLQALLDGYDASRQIPLADGRYVLRDVNGDGPIITSPTNQLDHNGAFHIRLDGNTTELIGLEQVDLSRNYLVGSDGERIRDLRSMLIVQAHGSTAGYQGYDPEAFASLVVEAMRTSHAQGRPVDILLLNACHTGSRCSLLDARTTAQRLEGLIKERLSTEAFQLEPVALLAADGPGVTGTVQTGLGGAPSYLDGRLVRFVPADQQPVPSMLHHASTNTPFGRWVQNTTGPAGLGLGTGLAHLLIRVGTDEPVRLE